MTTLPDKLSSLLNPQAYPHPVAEVQLVETHMSWVLLTGDFAYKIKKPVCYAFVDLRSPERRAFFCAEELRLNRRFARDLYIEVCEVTSSQGQVSIAGEGEVIEHAVRMRQFDRSQELDRLLDGDRVEPAELGAFGRYLARIHARLPVAGEDQDTGRPEGIRKVLIDNLDECREAAKLLATEDLMRDVHRNYAARIAAAAPWLEARWQGGRVRECHGDLHSRNIVHHGGRLVAFDCLEFDPVLRWIDVADDVAFLLMDLEARGFPLHAHAFMSGWLARSGDFEACRMFGLYQTHRALVRSKVTALEAAGRPQGAQRDAALRQYRQYLDYANRQLAPRGQTLLLMFGLSGSGKTWLAERLAPMLGATQIRSDVERKRLLGLDELQRTGSGLEQGLYSRDTSERVYGRLEECAEHALAAGYSVIVDAAFHRSADRRRFRRLAERRDVPVRLVHCRAPRRVLEQRIIDRGGRETDASEADLQVLEWQESQVEPVAPAEGFAVIEADTTRASIATEVREALSMSFPPDRLQ